MLHHVLPLLPTLYVIKDDLHPLCRPAHVTRLGHKTLVHLDRRALLAEVIMWVQENLTDAERVVIRSGFGASTDLTVPFADDLLDGTVADASLPACLELLPSAEHVRTA